MSDRALRMNHVFKRFRRGEQHDSLRDLIPSLVKRAIRKDRERALAPQEFWVLNDISFDVKKGETLGIIGHNGAGKSTMLKHLSGIMVPTRGSLEVNGRSEPGIWALPDGAARAWPALGLPGPGSAAPGPSGAD